MWKRFLQGWSAYRHAAALKGLLEALGLWKYFALVGAVVIGGAVGWASGLPKWLGVLLTLGVMATVLLIVGLVLAIIRTAPEKEVGTGSHDAEPDAINALTNCPKVVLSHGAAGIDLIVEALDYDAANVQLVKAQSKNYCLDSEIIRYLRKGHKQSLVLHCYQRADGSVQRFSPPHLFFEDFYPEVTGDNLQNMHEQILTRLLEQQLAADCEIAYSTVSVAEHFRSKFRIRFENFNDSIVDVEPLGICRDYNPPSAKPRNVID